MSNKQPLHAPPATPRFHVQKPCLFSWTREGFQATKKRLMTRSSAALGTTAKAAAALPPIQLSLQLPALPPYAAMFQAADACPAAPASTLQECLHRYPRLCPRPLPKCSRPKLLQQAACLPCPGAGDRPTEKVDLPNEDCAAARLQLDRRGSDLSLDFGFYVRRG